MRWPFVLAAIAGLYGALGVVAAAVAAHRYGGQQLATAAQFLLLHAVLVVALVAIALRSDAPRPWQLIAAVILLGAGLFGGDVALSASTGRHLFPRAAPTGGMLLIAGWAAMVVLAVIRLYRGAGL